jgi:very-short-patch-repair endonuclease
MATEWSWQPSNLLSPMRERIKGEGVIWMKQIKPLNLARALRIRQTDAEDKVWAYLRARRFEGLKFRRQVALGNFIVDFINFENKLIIEIDGGQHNEPSETEKDLNRTQWLESRGYKVIRFWNSDVIDNIDGVLVTIQKAVQKEENIWSSEWKAPPSPSGRHPLFQFSPVKGEKVKGSGERGLTTGRDVPIHPPEADFQLRSLLQISSGRDDKVTAIQDSGNRLLGIKKIFIFWIITYSIFQNWCRWTGKTEDGFIYFAVYIWTMD